MSKEESFVTADKEGWWALTKKRLGKRRTVVAQDLQPLPVKKELQGLEPQGRLKIEFSVCRRIKR